MDVEKAYDSQIVRAKENLKLSLGGSIRHHPTDESSGPGFSLSLMSDPLGQKQGLLLLRKLQHVS